MRVSINNTLSCSQCGYEFSLPTEPTLLRCPHCQIQQLPQETKADKWNRLVQMYWS